MAVKTVHVSDISGKEADEQTLGRLVVHEHPEYSDLPVTLEALPEELEQLQGTSARFVTVEWTGPGARKGERVTVPIEDFNLLAGPGVMDNAIQDAHRGREGTRPLTSRRHQQAPQRRRPARARPQRSDHQGALQPLTYVPPSMVVVLPAPFAISATLA